VGLITVELGLILFPFAKKEPNPFKISFSRKYPFQALTVITAVRGYP
jgi:hypothetical protein